MIRKFLIFILAFSIIILPVHIVYAEDASETATESTKDDTQLDLSAQSAVLIDAATGRILYQKNATAQMAMASTTKIMTCIIALEYGNLTDKVKVSAYAASMPDVQLDLKEGEEYYLGDLLYSLMLESHNDTAVAIAEYIGGSVEGFAELMNSKAKDIGAYNSNFVTPNGLDAENHYSTAYDMALIGAYAIQNEEFLKIINTPSYSFTNVDGSRSCSVTNKDAFLSQMEGAIGIKTGYTSKAGYCFVGALKKDNKILVSVVLASGWPPNKSLKWNDTKKLMNYGLENYSYKVLFDQIDNYKDLKVENGQKSSVATYIDGNFSALIKEEEQIQYYYKYEEPIEAPIEANQIIGLVEITIDGEVAWSYPIKAKEEVKKITFFFSLRNVIKHYII